MTTLLLVHHAPSPRMHALLDAALEGLEHEELEEVTTESVTALAATSDHVLRADGYVFLTPANFGYMSGAMKHFFDITYYTCLGQLEGRPYAACVHGDDDTTGAVTSIEKIVSGWQLEKVSAPLQVLEEPESSHLEAIGDLTATVAAHLLA